MLFHRKLAFIYAPNTHTNWKTCEVPSEKSGVTLILIASLIEACEVGKLLARYLSVRALPALAKRDVRKSLHTHVVAHFYKLAPCFMIAPNIIALGCRPCSPLCLGDMPIAFYHPSGFHDNDKRPPRCLATLFLLAYVVHGEWECQPCCVKFLGGWV